MTRARGVFYGWWLVGIACLMLTLMSLVSLHGAGVFLVELERQFGWTRTQLSVAFTLTRAEGAILGPLEGVLVDRLGARRMLVIGFTIVSLGFVLFSHINSLWQFYVAFMVISLGSGLGGFLPMITLVNNWFIRRRTLAIAGASSGIQIGGFLLPLMVLGMESHGFRTTALGMAVFILAITWLVQGFIRPRPEQYGLQPDGAAAPPPAVSADEPEPQFTARQALRTQAFWLLTAAEIAGTVSITALSLHLVPKLKDMGLSLGAASLVVLTYTAIALPARLAVGFLADRFPKPPMISACLLLQGAAILILALAQDISWAFAFAPLYGIAFGGRGPLMSALRGEYFGRKAFGTILGLSQFPSSLASLGAPLFAGYMYDRTESYAVPFSVFAFTSFLGGALMLFARRSLASRPR